MCGSVLIGVKTVRMPCGWCKGRGRFLEITNAGTNTIEVKPADCKQCHKGRITVEVVE